MNANKSKPKIPKGKYGISVLTIMCDDMYERGTGKDGRYIGTSLWDGKVWKGACINMADNSMTWMDEIDIVTHWMYSPELPKRCKK